MIFGRKKNMANNAPEPGPLDYNPSEFIGRRDAEYIIIKGIAREIYDLIDKNEDLFGIDKIIYLWKIEGLIDGLNYHYNNIDRIETERTIKKATQPQKEAEK